MISRLAIMDILGRCCDFILPSVSTYKDYRFLITLGVSMHNLLNYLMESSMVSRLITDILLTKFYDFSIYSIISPRALCLTTCENVMNVCYCY